MSEESELKRIGATPVKNSGRGKYHKGDGRLDIFTVDVKEYPKGFGVNVNNWAKICSDAMVNDQSEPALVLVLGDTGSKVRLGVVAWEIIEDYIRLRKQEEENG